MKTIILLLSFLVLTACTQYPTQTAGVIDDRPRLAFNASALPNRPSVYEVVIDGISHGTLDQFLVNENALQIISGPHTVEVLHDGQPVFTQKVVLGERTTRVIKVVEHE